MPIIATANEKQNYAPAPEGTHHAVCVDVIDLGMKPNPFKPGTEQHKINVAWQINELRDDGKRFVVYKRYTLSLNEKATLRKDLESWRGRAFTRDEEMGFDVESVIGANCLLNVKHNPSADGTRTYANVLAVMPLMKGMPKIAPLDYERPKPEEDAAPEPTEHHEPVVEDLDDSDITF
jgi:hypothetical protein